MYSSSTFPFPIGCPKIIRVLIGTARSVLGGSIPSVTRDIHLTSWLGSAGSGSVADRAATTAVPTAPLGRGTLPGLLQAVTNRLTSVSLESEIIEHSIGCCR